jgi:hypothetical protein
MLPVAEVWGSTSAEKRHMRLYAAASCSHEDCRMIISTQIIILTCIQYCDIHPMCSGRLSIGQSNASVQANKEIKDETP